MEACRIDLTGDTHGRFLRVKQWCDAHGAKPGDILIVLGDAGVNFFKDRRDVDLKRLLATLPVTLFCIHGNHEIRPQNIPTYREMLWHGGVVYREDAYPNILFAKDGEIFDFNGQKTLVIGGAYSVDKGMREEGVSWWADEQPSPEIKARVEAQLERAGWQVDVVLSHTAPIDYEPVDTFLPGIDQRAVDKTTEHFLQSIENRLTYSRWYCGHYHIARLRTTYGADRKEKGTLRFLFTDVVPFGQ